VGARYLEERNSAMRAQAGVSAGIPTPEQESSAQPVRLTPGSDAMERPEVSAWDVFISHASEDKRRVARPLADALTTLGLKVWYDETELSVGNSLRRSIDVGLANATYGVVILSPAFFQKSWPQKELDGLVSREVDGVEVILPVWYKVSQSDIRRYSPTLADKLGIRYTGDVLGPAAQIALRAYHGRRAAPQHGAKNKLDIVREALSSGEARHLVDAVTSLGDEFFWYSAPAVLVEALVVLLSQESDVAKATGLQICAAHPLPAFARTALSRHVRQLLYNENPAFVALAAKSLARMDDKHCIDDLRTLATGGQTVSVQVEAAAALVQLGAASGRETALALVRDGSDDTRLSLLDRLEEIPGSVGLDLAEQLALDPNVVFSVRSAAAVTIAAETVNTFDEPERKRFGEMFRRTLTSMAPDEQGMLLEKVVDWCQYAVEEFGVGYHLATTLIDFSAVTAFSVGRAVAACMVLTDNDHFEEAIAVRSRAWELLAGASVEEVEACGQYLTQYLYDSSPIRSSESDRVVALLRQHPRLKHWAPFVWNVGGDEVAGLALRYWNDREPYEMLQYFRRHPHSRAVEKLRMAAERTPGYESLMAKFALLKLQEIRLRAVLEDCLALNGWVVEDTLRWIDEAVASGQLKPKPDEGKMIELIRLRQGRGKGRRYVG
jgi:hypothetical protein